MLLAYERTEAPFAAYNVATGDYITVREIADLAIECLGLDPASVQREYGEQPRGWKGDVPVVGSTRAASARWDGSVGWGRVDTLRAAIVSLLVDAEAGRLTG